MSDNLKDLYSDYQHELTVEAIKLNIIKLLEARRKGYAYLLNKQVEKDKRLEVAKAIFDTEDYVDELLEMLEE